MSGLEIAGVVFGVLPILIEAVKSYDEVSRTFHTFRHFSKDVKAVNTQFKVQHGIWLNECRLLLRLVANETGAKDMLEDELDERWRSKDLNDKLNGMLKDSFDLCRSIMEAAKESVSELGKDLKKFDVLIEGKEENESVRFAIRKMRGRVKIAFEKPKYEKNIASLREQNTDLSQLRSHIGAFSEHKSGLENTYINHRALPARVNAIRTASQKLHEALSGAWCCGDLEHTDHYAKICLDAEVQPEVRLDLAISCHDTSRDSNHQYLQEPPIWLYVQSVSIETAACTTRGSQPTTKRKLSTSSVDDLDSTPTPSYRKTTTVGRLVACKAIKKKRVHFTDDDGQSAIGEIREITAQQMTSEINLCQTKNICHYLKQNLQICGKSVTRHCVGYLESPKMYKHIFYLQEKSIVSHDQLKRPNHLSVYSILELMGEEVDGAMTVVDQLKLAHKTAVAMLQFNDTPWLAQRWRLADLSYFGNRNAFDEEALKTLHLSSKMSSGERPSGAVMEGVEGTVQPYSDEDLYGINNMALFSLGVALLELGHWKSIESLSIQQDPNAILTARRLAARPTPLGPKYQEIARKCLQCNFGFGTDLNNANLQAAVYGDVVCQLEKMIESLSI
ncbi:hypothetical protein BDV96DRAFT_491096 [Lophiotrema nucula]|uniref:DUF7580 domain-containing protein n=1 Tax=Lophiotrema nucula TaxID=690887 RepID=A0A6A5ZEE2_9PLEO|nr:hypothetical protein BDV96DRAFT_491096 [Lophiotrema nucula]